MTADYKDLSEGSGSRHCHRYAVEVQDLAPQCFQASPFKMKKKKLRKRKGAYGSSWSRERSVKELDIGKACEELSWKHCKSTPHRSETKGNADRVKEGTSAVLPQS